MKLDSTIEYLRQVYNHLKSGKKAQEVQASPQRQRITDVTGNYFVEVDGSNAARVEVKKILLTRAR